MKNNVSSPEDYGLVEELVDLPVPQGGKVLFMRLVAAPIEAVVEFYGGAPSLGHATGEEEAPPDPGDKDWAAKYQASLLSLKEEVQKLLGLGCETEPAIAFNGPEPGKVQWERIHTRNRGFIRNRLVTLSGAGPGDGRLARMSTFPPAPRGGPVRAPAGVEMPDGTGPAPGAGDPGGEPLGG